jgi:hypothetical protein
LAVPANEKAGPSREGTPAWNHHVKIIPFPHRSRQTGSSIVGLFFTLPRQLQVDRIRALARSQMSAETISTITRMSLSEITQIIEGQR